MYEDITILKKRMDEYGEFDLHMTTEPVAIADGPTPDDAPGIRWNVFKCDLKVILTGEKPTVIFYVIGWGQDVDFHVARNLSREDALSQAIARFGGE